ncbi:hypothetical protein [Rhizobium leguminosarum]|uniref:hypothetical protein n=1 Tax=Rhizobium leguminosarum TaxID=384 RepID=UPI003F94F871
MKVTSKTTATTKGRSNTLSRAFDDLFAEIERKEAEDRVIEAKRRADEAESRTRRAIERQCRKSYFRKKYAAMGLWPLPPLGTPIT